MNGNSNNYLTSCCVQSWRKWGLATEVASSVSRLSAALLIADMLLILGESLKDLRPIHAE